MQVLFELTATCVDAEGNKDWQSYVATCDDAPIRGRLDLHVRAADGVKLPLLQHGMKYKIVIHGEPIEETAAEPQPL